MIYPLIEEIPALNLVLGYLNDELKNPWSRRKDIIDVLLEASKGRRCGLFCVLSDDVLAFYGVSLHSDYIPVDSEFGLTITDRNSRIKHLINNLDMYCRSCPENELFPRLFKLSLARLKSNGHYIPVVELSRLDTGCIICISDSGCYYVVYTVSRGFVDLEKVYQFSDNEVAAYRDGTLNIRELCKSIGATD